MGGAEKERIDGGEQWKSSTTISLNQGDDGKPMCHNPTHFSLNNCHVYDIIIKIDEHQSLPLLQKYYEY